MESTRTRAKEHLPHVLLTLHPFAVGGLQFMMIDRLGADSLGGWMLLMATIFALMNWVAHSTMRRARQDGDNEEFFRDLAPSTWRDFYGAYFSIAGLAGFGVLVMLLAEFVTLALAAVGFTLVLLCVQLWTQAYFWNRSVQPPAEQG